MQRSELQRHESEIMQLAQDMQADELRATATLVCWVSGLMLGAGHDPAWMVSKALKLIAVASRKEEAGG
jgi:hypothetical protein